MQKALVPSTSIQGAKGWGRGPVSQTTSQKSLIFTSRPLLSSTELPREVFFSLDVSLVHGVAFNMELVKYATSFQSVIFYSLYFQL